MKNKLIIIGIIVITILANMTIVQANSTATATLKSNSINVKQGDTFTVTLSVECSDGINGIDTTYNYDSDKLELVSASVKDSTNWSSLGIDNQITVICNSTSKITTADIYVLTFKVKDNATVGTQANISTTDIVIDSDEAINSECRIGSKSISITIVSKEITLKSNIYSIENNIIKRIKNKTPFQVFRKNIITNADNIKAVNKNNEEIKDIDVIGTGMRLILNNQKIYVMIVSGDTNGDGQTDLKDILAINKHRLNKTQLTNEYLSAGDVNNDGKVDIKDLLQINKYRLGKISEL